ncbi:hypothetical protein M8J76_001544 [Diaphorina citri]|nr:hypothetical protein M8J75_005363 [Diaphorina citri]KAI5744350.1 hypothetical protein M8J76_001544 [Diaphorina citri]KAI5750782.1 hypothetical protein M8J77_001211 [Diaphorina citri]
MLDHKIFFLFVRELVNNFLEYINEDIEICKTQFGDKIKSSTAGSALTAASSSKTVTSLSLHQAKDDGKKQLADLNAIKNTVLQLKEDLEKYFFASTDLDKDNEKIMKIYKQIKQEILKLGLCKIYVEKELKTLEKEYQESRNEDALQFIKQFIVKRKDKRRKIEEIKTILEKHNELEKNSKGDPNLAHKEQRDYFETKELCKNLELKLKNKDVHLKQSKAKIRKKAHEDIKELNSILELQNNTIEHYEKLLQEKMSQLEEQKSHLKQLLESDCQMSPNIWILLRDLKFTNLNLIFEYFCLRNEMDAFHNRLKKNRFDPNYKDRTFKGLHTEQEETESIIMDECMEEEENQDKISLYSHPSYKIDWQSSHRAYSSASFDYDFDQSFVYRDDLHLDDAFSIEQPTYEDTPEPFTTYQEPIIIRRPERVKLTWFNVHRTDLTPIVEAELRETRRKIIERSIYLEKLRKTRRLNVDLLEKKIALYQIRRYLIQHEEREYNKHKIQLDKTLYEIEKLYVELRKYEAQDDQYHRDKMKLLYKRTYLIGETRTYNAILEKERIMKANCRQKDKQVLAYRKTWDKLLLNKTLLIHWTRLVLNDPKVSIQQAKQKARLKKNQILEESTEKEWKRVNSNIKNLNNQILEDKETIERKSGVINKWEKKLELLNIEKQKEHDRIRDVKRRCFLLSRQLVELPKLEKWLRRKVPALIDFEIEDMPYLAEWIANTLKDSLTVKLNKLEE